MIVSGEFFNDLIVMSENSEDVAGKIVGPIINSTNLQIPAFLIFDYNSGEINKVIMSDDLDMSPSGDFATIDDKSQIFDQQDVKRVHDIIMEDFGLYKLPVFTKNGVRLGEVSDFAILLPEFKIEKIIVAQKNIRKLMLPDLIISRQQIIDVDHKQITVVDLEQKITSTRRVRAPHAS